MLDAAVSYASIGPATSGMSGVSGIVSRPPVATGPTFLPTDLFGMELWLPGSGYVVGTWTDASGKGRNATQATGSKQPALVAGQAEFNAKPVAAFVRANQQSVATASLTLPQPLTSILVAQRADTGGVQQNVVEAASGQASLVYGDGSVVNRIGHYAGTAVVGATNPGFGDIAAPHMFTSLLNGAGSALYANGLLLSAANPGAGGAASALRLGNIYSDASATFAFDGKIAEYVLYSVGLGAYDRLRVENYLAAKYALPVTFDPTSISGLQVWVRSDNLGAVGSAISSWADQSGNARNLAQATGSLQPTVGVGLNGRKFAKFDGVDDALSASFTAIAQPVTYVMVLKDASTNTHTLIDGTTTPRNLLYYSGGYSMFSTVDQTPSPALVTGVPSVVFACFNGASSSWVKDGVVGTVGNPGASSSPGIVVGNSAAGTSPTALDLYELLVYNVALTASQRQQLEGYLVNKYAVNAAIRPFDPLSIAGCQGWWQVDGGCDVSSDGSAIGTIYDRSGKGHPLAQATAGLKPLYKTARLNGRATALFDGVDDTMSAAFTQAQPVTVVAVMKQVTWAAHHLWDAPAGDNTMGLRQNAPGTPTLALISGGGAPTAIAQTPSPEVGQWAVFTAVYNGASSLAYTDGITGTTGSTAGAPGGFVLGSAGTGTSSSNSEFAEIIYYSGALSAQDRKTLEAYLTVKYGIGLKAPNDPTLSANLIAWFDASQIIGLVNNDPVTTWPDKSGLGNDAVGAGTTRPLYKTAVVNGRPALDFDAVDDYLATTNIGGASNTNWRQAGLTIIAVTYPRDIAGTVRPVFSNQNGIVSDSTFGHALYNTSQMSAQIKRTTTASPNSANLAANSWQIHSAVFANSGADILGKVWRNGGDLGTATLVGHQMADYPTVRQSDYFERIGTGLGASFSPFANMQIAEIAIFKTNLPDADRRAVENYLSQKYGIAV